MVEAQAEHGKAYVDVFVYTAYLAAFIGLLAFSSIFFGVLWLTIAFGGFAAAVVAILAWGSRTI